MLNGAGMSFTARHLAPALALVAACAPGPDDTPSKSEAPLTSTDRVPRYARIRDVAASRGLQDKAFLLAGIANHESGMAMCYAEATQYCAGPPSPDCGGGPVMAGGGDGPCADRAAGLGMFQFDAGDYDDTLRVYGADIVTIDGQIRAAVDFAVRMVKISAYTTNAETDEKALAWLNEFDLGNSGLRDQWIRTVLRYYNGCPEGGSCWSPRYRQYDDALTAVLDETHGTAFWASCGAVDGTNAIDVEYHALGACGGILGAPITAEAGAPDGVGRYRVFERGSIYWTPRTNADEVHGRIRDAWKDEGWEAGRLGYPTEDERAIPGGRRSVFEHGFITWDATTNQTTVGVR